MKIAFAASILAGTVLSTAAFAESFTIDAACKTGSTSLDGARKACDQTNCYRAPGSAVIDPNSISIADLSAHGSEHSYHHTFEYETQNVSIGGMVVPVQLAKVVCLHVHARSPSGRFHMETGWQNARLTGEVIAR